MGAFQIARFIELVSLLGQELAPEYHKVLQKVSSKELSCLKITEQFGPISMNELAQLLELSKSRTTQIINHLEDSGMVRRFSAQNDQRSIEVKIRPKGQRLLSELRKAYVRQGHDIANQLSPDELANLSDYIDKVSLNYRRAKEVRKRF